MTNEPEVSVVVPLYNEAAVLPELLHRLKNVLEELGGGRHEIVLVDDGSSDETPMLVRKAAHGSDTVRGILLSRNFGQQAAVTAGLDWASGEAIVMMDGDLQDPPEAIPKLVEKFREGYDVVYALRMKRKEAWWMRAGFRFFYKTMNALTTIPVPSDAGLFSVVSRRAVDQLRNMPERNRFLPGMRTWVGFRQCGVPVERSARHAGESKGLSRLVKLALDGVFSFSMVPLRAATILGAVTLTITGSYTLYVLYEKLFLDRPPQGFTAIIVTIVFMSGVQLFFLGVLGEYLGRVYRELKQRPHYIVADQIGEKTREDQPQ